MTFFTKDEFVSKYPEYSIFEDWKIEAVSEMIYSQVGLKYRDPIGLAILYLLLLKMQVWNNYVLCLSMIFH